LCIFLQIGYFGKVCGVELGELDVLHEEVEVSGFGGILSD
jgi:hypothetical protein